MTSAIQSALAAPQPGAPLDPRRALLLRMLFARGIHPDGVNQRFNVDDRLLARLTGGAGGFATGAQTGGGISAPPVLPGSSGTPTGLPIMFTNHAA